MKSIVKIGGLALALGLLCTSAVIAGDAVPPEWQKQSLKGITSIRYGMAEGSDVDSIEDVAKAFSGLKAPAKRITNIKEDYAAPLSDTEARVKVIAQNRKGNQCWVGLVVDQRCQVKRIPSIDVNGETYRSGKMCARADVKKAVNEVCAEFIKDFGAQAK
jgi:hypothetical protein